MVLLTHTKIYNTVYLFSLQTCNEMTCYLGSNDDSSSASDIYEILRDIDITEELSPSPAAISPPPPPQKSLDNHPFEVETELNTSCSTRPLQHFPYSAPVPQPPRYVAAAEQITATSQKSVAAFSATTAVPRAGVDYPNLPSPP